jgi:hypothetical protein
MKIPLQVKGGLKMLSFMLVMILSLWSYCGYRLGVWGPMGYLHYIDCVVGAQPIGHELWHGGMKPGYSMSLLVSRVNPSRLTRYGEWTEIYIQPGCAKVPDNVLLMGFGLYILAKNDSIVSAEFGSCTFQREFFNTLTLEESVSRVKDRDNYFRQLQR